MSGRNVGCIFRMCRHSSACRNVCSRSSSCNRYVSWNTSSFRNYHKTHKQLMDKYSNNAYSPCSKWASKLALTPSLVLRAPFSMFSLVQPQEVTEVRSVPEHIKVPPYIRTNGIPAEGRGIPIRSEKQINGMREACSLAKNILNQAGDFVKVGVTTDAIDQFVHRLAIDNDAYPSPLQYRGFPKSVCTSVNNVACHGIPDSRPLMDGDIINVDVTVYYRGFHGDCSETYLVGNVDEQGQQLVEVARRCRDAGISVCRSGVLFCEIGNIISVVAEEAGFTLVPVFCGHGIGENFHELPDIFHFAHDDDKVMKAGMTFTVEPIVCDGRPDVRILDDDWTAVMSDNSRAAQFEHTVLVTANGVEVLTL